VRANDDLRFGADSRGNHQLLEINVMTRLNRRLFSFSHESRKSACKRNTARPSQRRSHWVDLATGLQMEALERRLLLSGIPTSIAIAVSTQQAAYGQPIRLTASVAAVPTDPSEGTVTFIDKGTVLGSSAVNSGTATLDVRLPVGSHLLTASYNDAQGAYALSTTTAQSNSPITTLAGGGLGLNIAATSAELSYPSAVATDAAGDLFIAVNYGVLEVNHATGIITDVAGNGTAGNGGPDSGDGGPATAAELAGPLGIAVDSAGDLVIADTNNNRIREVNHATGIITTVAGNGMAGFSGDGGPATAAELQEPSGIAVDSFGNLFIADTYNDRIREVNHATGVISTVAGNGAGAGTSDGGFSGDGSAATAAELDDPAAVAVDPSGNLFIADTRNHRVREVNAATGVITTVVGNGTNGFLGDSGPATAVYLGGPAGIAIDSSGNMFIADTYEDRVREVNHATDIVTTVAGSGSGAFFSGDGGPATAAQLNGPTGIAIGSSGDLFIADASNDRIRKVDAVTGNIATIAGGGTIGPHFGDGGPATSAIFAAYAIALDPSGDLFVADGANNAIREVDHATGLITTVAGDGTAGFSGDGGPATSAELNFPNDVAVDAAGNLFIADDDNGRVREVNHATGLISSVTPDLGQIEGIAIDASGNLFVAAEGTVVMRVDHVTGVTSTVAGKPGVYGYAGDGGPATSAVLEPSAVAVDASGNLFIANQSQDPFEQPPESTVREVNHSTGLITTIAGGTTGFSGDGGPGTSAALSNPSGIAIDPQGNLLIADTGNQRVREINLATGVITTVAGNGAFGFSGDGGPAGSAQLDSPQDVAVDASGDLFIADTSNSR
jgi:trimeric autotransporter adhesin